MTEKLRVIYIAGSGRSGSTVLDTILGNHPEVESVGELMFAPRIWASRNEFCACGQPGEDCPFWREVQDAWSDFWPDRPPLYDWRMLQRTFERPGSLPRLFIEARRQSPLFRNYLNGVTTLYRAIGRVSGHRVIVDSSKNPTRAIALARAPDIDLHLLHLVRDCRGVVWSHSKKFEADPGAGVQRRLPPKQAWRTAVQWTATNLVTDLARRTLNAERTLVLRYEELTSHPESALKRVGELAGMDFSVLEQAIKANEKFHVGHTIAGNRIRMQGTLELTADTEWKDNMTTCDRRVVRTIAGSTARHYGYTDI